MAWINGLERKRFNEEQKRLAEQYRAAGMTEEQIEQMYQFDLVEFNSRRRFSEHTQQFSENAFEESDDDKSPLLEKYLAQLSTSLDFSFAGDRYGWVEEIEKPELIKGIKALSKEDIELIIILSSHSSRTRSRRNWRMRLRSNLPQSICPDTKRSLLPMLTRRISIRTLYSIRSMLSPEKCITAPARITISKSAESQIGFAEKTVCL